MKSPATSSTGGGGGGAGGDAEEETLDQTLAMSLLPSALALRTTSVKSGWLNKRGNLTSRGQLKGKIHRSYQRRFFVLWYQEVSFQ